MTTELETITAQVEQATDYVAVFGPCSGDSAMQAQHIKHVYRQLAWVLHPDRYTADTDRQRAGRAFAKLGEWLMQAENAIALGTYGTPVTLATVTTRKARHSITHSLQRGDLATLYAATTNIKGDENRTICKVATHPADNDLLQSEAAVLKLLRGSSTDDKLHPYVPELVDSFGYMESGHHRRHANVIRRLEGFYDLLQVREAFPEGLNPLDAAWIWRRLLVGIGFAHQNGVIHGAVLPAHIMILPSAHGMVIVDWCYASLADDGKQPPIRAIVQAYEDWYPEEVFTKQPPSPATDIIMAARTMIYLMKGDPLTGALPDIVPRQMRAFFKGCLQIQQTRRPNDAWLLLQEFDELLETMGSPYFPRRFHPFAMPSGTVSN